MLEVEEARHKTVELGPFLAGEEHGVAVWCLPEERSRVVKLWGVAAFARGRSEGFGAVEVTGGEIEGDAKETGRPLLSGGGFGVEVFEGGVFDI